MSTAGPIRKGPGQAFSAGPEAAPSAARWKPACRDMIIFIVTRVA
ncbi:MULTISPECIES: hypothetical protein [unclassified Streptosporangium]|nr:MULTISPECIES: hypothetical protein [unclassified Streptosporangium]